MFITGKDINNLIRTLNLELEKLLEWLNRNKLSLNIKKTHYIIFSLRKNINSDNDVIIN